MNSRTFRYMFTLFNVVLSLAIFIESIQVWLHSINTPTNNHLGVFLPWFAGLEAVSALLFIIPQTITKRIGGCLLLLIFATAIVIHNDIQQLSLCVYAAGVILVLSFENSFGFESISKRHSPLIICSTITFLLFLFFLALQFRKSEVLNLETKWLIVAGVPVLIGLIIGSYIKSFKGFGIELESLLELPVGKIDLNASDVVDALKSEEKRTTEYLRNLPYEDRLNIKRLTFVTNRRHYYREGDVWEYLRELPNLKYIEVRDGKNKFKSLIPVSYFRAYRGEPSDENIHKFIRALEANKLADLFGNNMITETVSDKEKLFDVLEKARNSTFETLAVISPDGDLKGVITVRIIEKRITDEVLKIQNQKN